MVNNGRLLAIGDIHGCYGALEELMDKVYLEKNDTIIFLGDYIDRGGQEREVVEYLIELENSFPKAVFLKGNHEDMLEDYLTGKDPDLYLYNGGLTTLQSYEFNIPKKHQDFLINRPLYKQIGDFIFVHAGIDYSVPNMKNQKKDDLLWIRKEFFTRPSTINQTVVFGHTPIGDLPWVGDKKIGIDTGAVFGGRLTTVQLLPKYELYQVEVPERRMAWQM